MTDERLGLWLGFIKWFVSSVIITSGVAITSIILHANHQNTMLQMAVNQNEKEYLNSFLDNALDDNLEKRYRFAEYFSILTQSESYRSAWNKYLSIVKQERARKEHELIEIQKSLSDKTGEALDIARAQISELREELSKRFMLSTRSRAPRLHVPLENLVNYKVECPIGNTISVWSESILLDVLGEHWQSGYYIALGCTNIRGTKNGPAILFHPNGTVAQRTNYIDGRTNGEVTTFYRNGAKAAQWHDRYGVAIGSVEYWDHEGNDRDADSKN